MADAEPAKDSLTSATSTISDTAKWLITIFAGVAGVLVAGSQLSSLGKLDLGPRLLAALAGLALGIAGAAYAVMNTVPVLTSARVRLAELAVTQDKDEQRFLQDNAELLLGLANDARELKQRYDIALSARAQAFTRLYANPTDADLNTQAKVSDAQASNYSQAVGGLLTAARYDRVRRKFEAAQREMLWGGLFAAAGIALFAWAANPPEPPAESSAAVPNSPVAVRVFLTPDGTAALTGILGEACVTDPAGVEAIALEASDSSATLVSIGTASCKVARFSLGSSLGVVKATEQVNPPTGSPPVGTVTPSPSGQ
jgi:hypothetical protein